MKTAWYDIEVRGRRLEALSKQMNKSFWNNIENNQPLAFAYLDRLLKIESTIQPYVEQITGLNRFLKKHDKVKEDSILN